jgi:hypothetical protein
MLGINKETLKYWHKTDFYRATKPSFSRVYNFYDMCMLTSIVELKRRNISIQKMRKHYIPKLREHVLAAMGAGHNIRDLRFYLGHKKAVVIASRTGLYSDLTLDLVLDFGELWDELSAMRNTLVIYGDTLGV